MTVARVWYHISDKEHGGEDKGEIDIMEYVVGTQLFLHTSCAFWQVHLNTLYIYIWIYTSLNSLSACFCQCLLDVF